jgi:hypothetical protein
MSELVVTYRLAYVDDEVELCDECAAHPPEYLGPLGQVQYGAHEGECEICRLFEDH